MIGAADCVLKCTASAVAQQAATAANPSASTTDRSSAPVPGKDTPSANASTSANAIGTTARTTAPATVEKRSAQRGAGETSSRSNQPCSMSRARFTPVAAPENPAACI